MTQILVDTGCDLTREQLAELGIDIIPFTFTIADISFKENVDKTTQEVYELMAQYPDEIPKTAQINPLEFLAKYEAAYEQGVTDFISVSINSQGSGTYNNSILAKNDFYEAHPEAEGKMRIYNLDGQSYSAGYGYPVAAAAKMVQDGVPAEQIVAFLQEWFDRSSIYATPPSLKYAKLSGRISAAAAFAGDMLGLKPIIQFASGGTKTVGKFRGEKNVVPNLSAAILRDMDKNEPYVMICGKSDTQADELQAVLEKELGKKPEMRIHIGAVVSANIGPDVVGVLFKRK